MLDAALATVAGVLAGSRRVVALALVAAALASTAHPRVVCAAETADTAELRRAEAAATEAKVFFKAGLFDKASAKFMEAYAISKRPSLMYNAARAYEEGQNFREAVALLKHYVDLPDVGEDGRRDAQERIGRLEAVLRQQQAAEEARRLEAARQAEAARKAEEARLAEQRKGKDPIDTPLPRDPTSVTVPAPGRHVSWVLAAGTIGAGVLAGGAYLEAYLEARSAQTMTIKDDNDVSTYLERAQSAKIFQGVAIGSAVVAGGLAAWTFIDWWRSADHPAENSAPKAALSVFPAPGGGMLSLRGGF